jgi:hypothetical protein
MTTLRTICQSNTFPRLIELGVQARAEPDNYALEYRGAVVFRFPSEDDFVLWIGRHANPESIADAVRAEYDAAEADVKARAAAEAEAATAAAVGGASDPL